MNISHVPFTGLLIVGLILLAVFLALVYMLIDFYVVDRYFVFVRKWSHPSWESYLILEAHEDPGDFVFVEAPLVPSDEDIPLQAEPTLVAEYWMRRSKFDSMREFEG